MDSIKKSISVYHEKILYRDIVIILCACITAFIVASFADLFEWIIYIVHKYEKYQLDETLIVLGILAISLSMFSFRRWDDLKKEINLRMQIEKKLIDSIKTQDILLKEIHHRVKNNFQIISSLLDLQKEKITDSKLIAIFQDSVNRIRTMALIHDRLYNSDSLSQIDFANFIRDMTDNILASAFRQYPIAIDYSIEQVMIDIGNAIPCGLIINELITNSLKHAFAHDCPDKRIHLVLKKEKDHILLGFGDNGTGMPPSFDINQGNTLGLKLVSGLVRQIRGTLEIKTEQGTFFSIRIPCLDNPE